MSLVPRVAAASPRRPAAAAAAGARDRRGLPLDRAPGGRRARGPRDRRVAEDPRLRGAGGTGARRDGCRVPGAASAARPPRRPEDAPGRLLRRSRAARALPAGGGGGGWPSPREYRSVVRRRRPGRPAVLHHGIRRRWQPRSKDRRHAATGTSVRRARWRRWRRPSSSPTRVASSTAT